MDPPKEPHQRRRRLKREFSEMNEDPIATPQLMHKAMQESEEPDISRSTLQHQARDAPVKTPGYEQG
jgi:hypothetical protein